MIGDDWVGRNAVSDAGHRVLDALDAGRAGWAKLEAEQLEIEIDIEVATMVGGGASIDPARLAALVIYSMERAAS